MRIAGMKKKKGKAETDAYFLDSCPQRRLCTLPQQLVSFITVY